MLVARNPLLEYALVILYWASRLHGLLVFPAFDDETIFIRAGKMVWVGLPFYSADQARILNPLIYAVFFPFGPGALWVSRAAYLFLGCVGLIALIRLGQVLFDRTTGRLAAFFLLLTPLAFFYERMAFADPPGMVLLVVLALCSVRIQRRRDPWSVGIGGLALASVVLSKLSHVMYGIVPLLTLALFWSRVRWRTALRQTTSLYVVGIAVLAPILGFLIFRAHATFGLDFIHVFFEPVPIMVRIGRQLATLTEFFDAYLPWSFVVLAGTGLVWGILQQRKGAWLLALIAGMPLTVLVVLSNFMASRYLTLLLPSVLLLAAFATSRIADRMGRQYSRWILIGGLALLAFGGPARFFWLGWNDPTRLPLPTGDRDDFITDWPSGYGVDELAQAIAQRSRSEPLNVVVTEGWHVPALSLYQGFEPNLQYMYDFDQPHLTLHWLNSGCDPFLWEGLAQAPTWLVAERYRYASVVECLQAHKTLIASYPKPGGKNVIDVYEIRPLP